ncbi:MAG TPA: tRNA pseudouridine(55) synthase TruB [Thermodesulfovibrionales bacterium]|nr:tRNA pseudouridine(55) synthase TruB [Thermodesulfovibrionales bacterium]
MDAVINIDKPGDLSSQQAVTTVKKIVGTRKAGHAGTLDPLATGVLLVCTGEATKVTRFLADLDKEYIALMKLGEKTDTLDSEGVIVKRTDNIRLEREDLEKTIERFVGRVAQIPPMYSAIKVGGKRLYTFARKGMELERPERTVEISRIEITRFDLPWLEIRVLCSKGTYIRTLCDDLGDALGVGAHVTALRRTRIGNFRVEDSATPGELRDLMHGLKLPAHEMEDLKTGMKARVLVSIASIDAALAHLGEIILTDEQFAKARNGAPFISPIPENGRERFLRMRDPSGNLFAIGKTVGHLIKIERILHVSG